MNKQKLDAVFSAIKTAAGLDYAITDTDEYGDCATCVNYELCERFGVESKGIFVKHWLYGMNAGDQWEDVGDVYIAHDLTEEQAQIMVDVLEVSGYDVEPKEYNPSKCFLISEVSV